MVPTGLGMFVDNRPPNDNVVVADANVRADINEKGVSQPRDPRTNHFRQDLALFDSLGPEYQIVVQKKKDQF